jgi:hypothetical protein
MMLRNRMGDIGVSKLWDFQTGFGNGALARPALAQRRFPTTAPRRRGVN